MLQIRLSLPSFALGIDFSDPIILQNAANIRLTKTLNSSEESISFELAMNDPKQQYVNYLRWWECWDTETNTRLNFGPITEIRRASGDAKRITGPGRSALFLDYYKSIRVIDGYLIHFLDGLRYENLSAEPRTSTIINTATDSDYYGLSLRTKDYVIDEDTGGLPLGSDIPLRGLRRADQFWSGVAKADWLTVDLGEPYYIYRSSIYLPWWGGAVVNRSRRFDWQCSGKRKEATGIDTLDSSFHLNNRTSASSGLYHIALFGYYQSQRCKYRENCTQKYPLDIEIVLFPNQSHR